MNWILKRLSTITVIYLLLPIIIFVLGWLKLYFAIPLILISLWSVYLIVKNDSADHKSEDDALFQLKYIYHLLIGLAVLLVWVYLSGNGGFSFQNSDWYKHNAILHHLIYSKWPVRFDYLLDYQNVALVYYVAFYLPAAVVGKLFGWFAANIALFAWVYIGIVLTWLWLCRLSKRLSYWIAIILVVFGGLDFIGNYILTNKLVFGTVSSEWWSGIWQYSSNTTQLFWVPQQAIAAWLFVSLLTYDYLQRKSNANVIFYFAISLLWSPLVSIGLLPYSTAVAFGGKIKQIFNFQNLAFGLTFIAIFGLFFLSNFENSKSQPSTMAWLWQSQKMAEILPTLVLFYLIEFGVFVVLCWNTIGKSDLRQKIWWYIMIVFLMFAPLFKFGLFNDFAMRSTIPSLFALVILICITLFNREDKQYAVKAMLAVVLILASAGAYVEATRARINNKPNMEEASNLSLESLEPSVIAQYLGTQDSAFYKYFSK